MVDHHIVLIMKINNMQSNLRFDALMFCGDNKVSINNF